MSVTHLDCDLTSSFEVVGGTFSLCGSAVDSSRFDIGSDGSDVLSIDLPVT